MNHTDHGAGIGNHIRESIRPHGLVIRTVGKARAIAKLALANLAYNFIRFLWLDTPPASPPGATPRPTERTVRPRPADVPPKPPWPCFQSPRRPQISGFFEMSIRAM